MADNNRNQDRDKNINSGIGNTSNSGMSGGEQQVNTGQGGSMNNEGGSGNKDRTSGMGSTGNMETTERGSTGLGGESMGTGSKTGGGMDNTQLDSGDAGRGSTTGTGGNTGRSGSERGMDS